MSAFFYNVVHRIRVFMDGFMLRIVGGCLGLLLFWSVRTQARPVPDTLLLPYFLKYATNTHGDTTFEMRCYDKQDSIVKKLEDFSVVRYVCKWMHYTDPLHPYKDFDGMYKPLPVSVITERYEKMGATKWMYINYTTKAYKSYTAHPKTIVDSFILSIVDAPNLQVYYYKVSEN